MCEKELELLESIEDDYRMECYYHHLYDDDYEDERYIDYVLDCCKD